MTAKKKKKKRSLRTRIFLLILGIVAFTIVLYSGLSYLRYISVVAVNIGMNEQQNEVITETLTAQMNDSTIDTFKTTIELAAQISDDGFKDVSHDLTLLSEQVRQIITDPERYDEIPILRPNAANSGKMVPQLMFSEGIDEETADPDKLSLVYKIGNLSGMLEKIAVSNPSVHDMVIALPEGISVCLDNYSDLKIDGDGNYLPYNVTHRPWYVGAEMAGGIYYSPVNVDSYDSSRQIAISVPVYVYGKLSAIVAASVDMARVEQIIARSGLGNHTKACLVSNYGTLFYSGFTEGELGSSNGEFYNLRESSNSDLVEVVNDVLNGGSGCVLMEIDSEPYYVGYAPLKTIGFGQLLIESRDDLMAGTNNLLEETNAVYEESQERMNDMVGIANVFMLIFATLIFFLSIVFTHILANRLSSPITELNAAGLKFIGRKDTDLTEDKSYFSDLHINTGDEIEELGSTLRKMEINIADSMDRIRQMSSARQRIDAELSLAAELQANMLSKDFELPSERIRLFASMDPANEVGGDFYDFFMIDDDHLMLVIADVSGKGVPGAMFMTLSMIYIKSYGTMDVNPASILEKVNNAVLERNEDGMFVTAWIGVLELSTGHLIAANAGHEYPAIRRAGGSFELFKDTHGLVLGAMEDMKYEDYELDLNSGDILFVYTDGIVEATDSDGSLWGEKRMIDSLNETSEDDPPEEILAHVTASVAEFVGEAPQFDDMTMLAIHYI